LAAGLRPDPLGELSSIQRSPIPLAGLRGREVGKEKGLDRKGEGRRKGEDPPPQCLKCVDANAWMILATYF